MVTWGGTQVIDQVHVQPGDERRGWDRMIRGKVFKQLTQVHVLPGDG
jgi:hypothetical protein